MGIKNRIQSATASFLRFMAKILKSLFWVGLLIVSVWFLAIMTNDQGLSIPKTSVLQKDASIWFVKLASDCKKTSESDTYACVAPLIRSELNKHKKQVMSLQRVESGYYVTVQ